MSIVDVVIISSHVLQPLCNTCHEFLSLQFSVQYWIFFYTRPVNLLSCIQPSFRMKDLDMAELSRLLSLSVVTVTVDWRATCHRGSVIVGAPTLGLRSVIILSGIQRPSGRRIEALGVNEALRKPNLRVNVLLNQWSWNISITVSLDEVFQNTQRCSYSSNV